MAFFMAAYALMFSAFQTLNTEGNALWILYSVPQSLESILRQKAILWGIVCLAYPLAIFAVAPMVGAPLPDLLGPASLPPPGCRSSRSSPRRSAYSPAIRWPRSCSGGCVPATCISTWGWRGSTCTPSSPAPSGSGRA